MWRFDQNRFISDRDPVSKYHSSRYRGKEKARAPIQDTALGISVLNPNHASTLHTLFISNSKRRAVKESSERAVIHNTHGSIMSIIGICIPGAASELSVLKGIVYEAAEVLPFIIDRVFSVEFLLSWSQIETNADRSSMHILHEKSLVLEVDILFL